MNLRFLTALNVAMDDAALFDLIDDLVGELETGNLIATTDGDLIVGLSLTPAGRSCLPMFLPDSTA
jgi:hypothetical protein